LAETQGSADLDQALKLVAGRLLIESDREHEVLAELRSHLEEATDAGVRRGLSRPAALQQAVDALGVTETADELHQTHAGLGVREGVLAAAVLVVLALALRWVTFAPEGTATRWRVLVEPQALALACLTSVAVVAWWFRRSRYAVAVSAFFGAISLITAVWPAARW